MLCAAPGRHPCVFAVVWVRREPMCTSLIFRILFNQPQYRRRRRGRQCCFGRCWRRLGGGEHWKRCKTFCISLRNQICVAELKSLRVHLPATTMEVSIKASPYILRRGKAPPYPWYWLIELRLVAKSCSALDISFLQDERGDEDVEQGDQVYSFLCCNLSLWDILFIFINNSVCAWYTFIL